jgi:hypothetical protein
LFFSFFFFLSPFLFFHLFLSPIQSHFIHVLSTFLICIYHLCVCPRQLGCLHFYVCVCVRWWCWIDKRRESRPNTRTRPTDGQRREKCVVLESAHHHHHHHHHGPPNETNMFVCLDWGRERRERAR